jgi:hypothetical protein
LASQATYQVFQTEQARLAHDRLRHVSEITREYIRNARVLRPCLQVLLDDTLLDAAEFRTLLSTSELFHYNPEKHARLTLCLREKIAVPPASYPWADADARSVASYVSDELNHLDSYLISYKYEIGDRAIICENIRGFLEPHERLLQRFLQRLIDLRMLNDDNFPNINLFMAEYQKTNYTCPEYASTTVGFFQFLKAMTADRVWARP